MAIKPYNLTTVRKRLDGRSTMFAKVFSWAIRVGFAYVLFTM
jgi:hypothetical protein